jgi:hypothetical protein
LLEGHRRWGECGVSSWTAAAVAACARFASLSYDIFTNQRLLAEGLAPSPPPFTAYLDRCLTTSRGTIDDQARDDA